MKFTSPFAAQATYPEQYNFSKLVGFSLQGDICDPRGDVCFLGRDK